VKVRDVEGGLIGKNLIDALKKRGCNEEKSFIILNDTVATLLAGKAASPDRVFDSYIGFILGTGTNICYSEKCSNIGKVPELKGKDGSMLINIESGAYARHQGEKLTWSLTILL
jgi:hexokinase